MRRESDAAEVGTVPGPELDDRIRAAGCDGLVWRAVLRLQASADESETERQADLVAADRLPGRADVAVGLGLDGAPPARTGGVGDRIAAPVAGEVAGDDERRVMHAVEHRPGRRGLGGGADRGGVRVTARGDARPVEVRVLPESEMPVLVVADCLVPTGHGDEHESLARSQ